MQRLQSSELHPYPKLPLVITRIAEGQLNTRFGVFTEYLYYDGQKESIAIVVGDIQGHEDVLCRIHSHCISAHIFNSIECDCREQMEIDSLLGPLDWQPLEGKKSARILLTTDIDPQDPERTTEICEWFALNTQRFYDVFKDRVARLEAP